MADVCEFMTDEYGFKKSSPIITIDST